MPYIPHTPEETKAMLDCIGVSTTEALFDEIPHTLRSDNSQLLEPGMNEMAMRKHAKKLAQSNQETLCFIGAGCYEHHIPAAVWDIASRGEFLTAYTPYQAEASQGTLQLLYEFQSMIAELTGMDVANASLYDGASALAEAVLMSIRINQKSATKRVLVPETLHPLYRETLDTILRNQNIEILTLPFDATTGTTALSALNAFEKEDITTVVIACPNFFGCIEDVDALSDWANTHHVISVACVNPVALGLLKPPSDWGQYGVDIVCGEGQPFGSPMASGGPFFGFLSTRQAYVRQMPGRLIGQTVDKSGKIGYALTLQAREQHIRRGKATSNICTNQGLLVTAAAIHMSLLGPEGLAHVAMACHQNTIALMEALLHIPGVTRVFQAPIFHEVVLNLPKTSQTVLQALQRKGIAGGYAICEHLKTYPHAILVCATEMRTTEDIVFYANALRDCLNEETRCPA